MAFRGRAVLTALGTALALALCAPAVRAQAPAPDDPPIPHEPWDGWHAWPLLGHDVWTAPSGQVVRDRWSVAWPLLQAWSAPSTDGAGFAAPWPLIGAQWTPQYTHWRLLPIAAYWRWDQERLFALLPFTLTTWSPGRMTALFPLVFVQRDPQVFRAILFPVAWWFDEPDGGLRTLWPLCHYRWQDPVPGPPRRHLDLLPATLLPVGAWWAAADGDDTYFGLAWPLLYGYRARGDRWSMRFLFEGLVCWSDGRNHFGWRVLAGLFSYETWAGTGSYRWSMFWGLIVRDRTGAATSGNGS